MSKYPKYGKTKRPKGPGDDPFWLFDDYVMTVKVDGTSGRICWDGEQLEYGSRNRMVTPDDDNYGFAEWCQENIDPEPFREHFDEVGPVVVFGEFFSKDIQKRIAYPEEPQFVVFDLYIGSKYLDWEDVVDVTDKLNLELVKHKTINNNQAKSVQRKLENGEAVIDPYAVDEASDEQNISEGVVVRPPVELVEPYGSDYGTRLTRKIKSDKFEEINENQSDSKGTNHKYPQEDIETVMKYVTKNRIFSVLEDMKEDDFNIKFERSITGQVIKNTFKDMEQESEEELNEEVMRNVAGNEIAQLYFEMLDEGYTP